MKNTIIQPQLENELFQILPLEEFHFPALYRLAMDPFLWENHPCQDRYLRHVFKEFLKDAMNSCGAVVLKDRSANEIIGCSRYYNYDPELKSILIGYSFIGRKYWAQGVNAYMKRMMLDHIFNFVEKVYFHVGVENINSNNAMRKLPALLIGTEQKSYDDKKITINNIYLITKDDWNAYSLLDNHNKLLIDHE